MANQSKGSTGAAMGTFEYAPAPESRAVVDLKSSYGLFINGEFVEGTRPRVQVGEPGDRGGARRDLRGERGRRRHGGQGRPPRLHAHLVEDVGRRARQVPLPDRPHPAGAGPRAGRARVARQRQADPGVARRRRPARRGVLLLLRRLGRQARARGLRPEPAAARRRRPGHPVELPAADAGLEDRPGPGVWQHRRAQAGRDDQPDRPAVRRDLPAGRPAARRRQHRHRGG